MSATRYQAPWTANDLYASAPSIEVGGLTLYLPPWARWVAMAEDGVLCCYSRKPLRHDFWRHWYLTPSMKGQSAPVYKAAGWNEAWRDTLRRVEMKP